MSVSPDPTAFDWSDVRRQLRRLVGGLSGGADAHLVDDLVQEACVRLLRVSRREPVREPDALLATLARRTWYDHLRRAVRNRERFQALGDRDPGLVDPAPAWESDLGDPAARLALVVQEIFVGQGAETCTQLLQSFLAAVSWQRLAEQENLAYSTLRKRWSRCLALARSELAADPDLAPWLD